MSKLWQSAGIFVRSIRASCRDLAKDELLAVLGQDERPLPDAIWAPLYLAAEKGLIEKGGLLTFFHDYLRQAVEARYMPGPGEVKKNHSRLATYFSHYPEGTRQLEELSWQYAGAEEWDELVKLLTDESFFLKLYVHRKFDLLQYWVRNEAGSSLRMIDAYRPVLEIPGDRSKFYLTTLDLLLEDTGHPAEAKSYSRLYKASPGTIRISCRYRWVTR